MMKLSEVVVDHENKVIQLIDSHNKIKEENKRLLLLIDEVQEKLKEKNAEISHYREKYQRTKVASALNNANGSNEGVKETKLKINSLVREIDSCIALIQG